MDSTKKTPGQILALLLILLLLYLIYVAGRWGMADVYSRPAINRLMQWQRGGIQLVEEDWDRHAANLKQALEYDPDNPEIMQWLGLAVEGRFVQYAPNYPPAWDGRNEAADYYRIAIRLRPAWPYAWADLALVKYRLDEIDAEFYKALHKAVEYGPWEAGIQNVVSELGILLWDHLPEEEQQFILEVMHNGLVHPNRPRARRLMDMIKRRGFLAESCGRFKDVEDFQEYCVKNM